MTTLLGAVQFSPLDVLMNFDFTITFLSRAMKADAERASEERNLSHFKDNPHTY